MFELFPHGLNLARKGELTALVRVTAAIANKIIEARPISSNLQIDKIIGDTLSDIGEATLRTKLFLPINLNTV